MKLILKTLCIALLIFSSNKLYSHDESKKLPIPRFVSIKSSEVNIRTGPNTRYPIKWIFKQKGEPVEIIAEFEHWRKIRDYTKEEGWIHESMVKGSRTGVIIGSELQNGYVNPDKSSKIIMHLEPEVRVRILNCKNNWCNTIITNKKAWLEKKSLWGVYRDENFISNK